MFKNFPKEFSEPHEEHLHQCALAVEADKELNEEMREWNELPVDEGLEE